MFWKDNLCHQKVRRRYSPHYRNAKLERAVYNIYVCQVNQVEIVSGSSRNVEGTDETCGDRL